MKQLFNAGKFHFVVESEDDKGFVFRSSTPRSQEEMTDALRKNYFYQSYPNGKLDNPHTDHHNPISTYWVFSK